MRNQAVRQRLTLLWDNMGMQPRNIKIGLTFGAALIFSLAFISSLLIETFWSSPWVLRGLLFTFLMVCGAVLFHFSLRKVASWSSGIPRKVLLSGPGDMPGGRYLPRPCDPGHSCIDSSWAFGSADFKRTKKSRLPKEAKFNSNRSTLLDLIKTWTSKMHAPGIGISKKVPGRRQPISQAH